MAAAISIIIPHLNQPEFLARCLQSLEPQVRAMPDVEVIVVDNGSRALPADICARFANVALAQEAQAGPGPARNKGIALSQGGVLAFIDADCVAHERWLGALAAEFAGNPATQIVGGDVRIGLADATKPTILEAYESVFAYRQEEYIQKHGFSGTGNLAMRKAAYEAVGPFAGIEIAEDRDWGRRARSKGIPIKYLAGMVVYHPARKSFAELVKKWDRHIDHDFNERAGGIGGKLKWAGLAVAVAASGLIDIRKVLVSRRIATWRECWLASCMLARIRIYRAKRMLALLLDRRGKGGPVWNR
jgi:glycosyltransferase involved in cell wall biosynthesis